MKNISLVLFLFVLFLTAHAQTASMDREYLREKIDKLSRRSGADAFRDHSKLSTQDSASAVDRGARDAYWNIRLPHPPPGVFSGVEILRKNEFSREKGTAWFVGTIEAYAMRSPRLHRGAYTELELRVEQTVVNDSPRVIESGSLITLEEAGGTILEDGKERSYFLDEEAYPFLPSHRYLLEARYHEVGNFWLARAKWDLTTGIVVPDDDISLAFWGHNKSQIAGMQSDAAVLRAAAILFEAAPKS